MLFITFFANATIIRVPAQYPTIQQGLNAAQYGDTVLVAANTYVENISWPMTDGLSLMSESGPVTTIIDGNNAGRVINFPNYAYNINTVIAGFTIQNGFAIKGGGIYSYGSPNIVGNIIQYNTAQGTSTWVYGGGIHCDGSGAPRIEYNIFNANVARGEYWNYGGAIYIDDGLAPFIIGNLIMNDSTIGGYWNYGAGIFCDQNTIPDIRHNIIHSNVAYGGDRGYGVGIHTYNDCTAYILSNLIYNNIAQSNIWNYGAGIHVENGTIIYNNTIVGNSCIGGNTSRGGGINVDDSTNIIANNIVVNNNALYGGGIGGSGSAHATLMPNDVWNNTGGNYYNFAPGLNDISLDPLFVAGPLGDYYLSQIAAGQAVNSPCFDYGFTAAESLQLNTSTTRTDTIYDEGVVDLGYHYPGSPWVYIFENRMDPKGIMLSRKLIVAPTISNSCFTIRVINNEDTKSKLCLYDCSGRKSQIIYDGKLSKEINDFQLPVQGNMSAGIYFIVLESENQERITEKIIITK
ncbi:hypothetical protein A2Y85_06220 [candidate division WOR-3 bacterium RBG_13_43_14]|uniref:Right handed beta helix domain-containing protein n=1 Tax=candidate division WOR-3 bacterium RBG_13_43_14 TaxID=1802590 RepID=A0A1F4UCJ6_UNCW3|nr:MAG: hypothetical protein A2Y85_06220 [candidate division WOR-3 bacterium RBG_13_43_14]